MNKIEMLNAVISYVMEHGEKKTLSSGDYRDGTYYSLEVEDNDILFVSSGIFHNEIKPLKKIEVREVTQTTEGDTYYNTLFYIDGENCQACSIYKDDVSYISDDRLLGICKLLKIV